MSSCIVKADDMFQKKDGAVSKKKSLVVVIFFAYCVYSTCIVFKYLFSLDDIKKKYPTLFARSKTFAKVADDMIGKNFFYLLVLMMSSQVDPSVFTSFVSYGYLGVLGLQVFGALLASEPAKDQQNNGQEEKTPPNFRALGILAILILTMLVYWSLMISGWCKMFFYAQIFSKTPLK